MTTNLERASIVSRHVQLASVALAAADVRADLDPLTPPKDLLIDQAYRAQYMVPDGRDDHLYVSVEFTFQVFDSEEGERGDKALDLTAKYLLVYRLEGAETYPADALTHFAHLNGAYNAWPYWRELVQTVTGRVGLAGILIPVFRPPVEEVDDQLNIEEVPPVGADEQV